jgi:hypothetical protein
MSRHEILISRCIMGTITRYSSESRTPAHVSRPDCSDWMSSDLALCDWLSGFFQYHAVTVLCTVIFHTHKKSVLSDCLTCLTHFPLLLATKFLLIYQIDHFIVPCAILKGGKALHQSEVGVDLVIAMIDLLKSHCKIAQGTV